MSAKFELIAPCFFGCEATANFELRRIGAENIRVSDGRLTFSGGPEMIAAANLNLRTVELQTLNEQIEQQQTKNEELQRILSGDADDVTEWVARDSYNYAAPNERIFVDVTGN